MLPAGLRNGQRTPVLRYVALLVALAVFLGACQAPPSPAVAPAATASATPVAVHVAVVPTPTVVMLSPTPTIAVEVSPEESPEPSPAEEETEVQTAPLLQVPGAPAPSTSNPQGGSTEGRAGMRLRIPRLGVDAPIVEVGLLDSGEMAAPKNGEEVVWYGGSAVPGKLGNALLAGHLDWAGKGAVFWRLRDLRPGDNAVVVAPDGTEIEFTVTHSDLYPARDAPMDEITAAGPEPLITLITCEGTFNRATHDYSHRRVVQASLSN